MKIKVKLTLTEEMLGTKSADPEVFATYIASKHPSGTPQKDELDSAEKREETGTTIFSRQNGVVGIYDYTIKGFLKAAISALNRADKEYRDGMDKLTAYMAKIDGCIFVAPRFIPITFPPGGTVGVCERALRTTGPQGPRVTLVRAETVPAGSTMEFEFTILSSDLGRWVQLALDYGAFYGMGQWRNSGKGRFTWAQVDG